jgi:hypothetical protein
VRTILFSSQWLTVHFVYFFSFLFNQKNRNCERLASVCVAFWVPQSRQYRILQALQVHRSCVLPSCQSARFGSSFPSWKARILPRSSGSLVWVQYHGLCNLQQLWRRPQVFGFTLLPGFDFGPLWLFGLQRTHWQFARMLKWTHTPSLFSFCFAFFVERTQLAE